MCVCKTERVYKTMGLEYGFYYKKLTPYQTLPSNLRFATFPFRDGKKQCKGDFTRQNFGKIKFYKITYNFVPKNAMKLHFDKSFD